MTLKQLFGPSYMTAGKPWEKIAIFTVPLVLGNIAQQLYATVDSTVLERYAGEDALMAVACVNPIMNLLLSLFIGISVAAGVMVSQYFGAKEREKLSKAIGNCIAFTLAASLIIMVLGVLGVRPLLKMLKTPESIIDGSASYLMVIMLGISGMAFYNVLCGILRGLGDSFSALIYLLIALALNTGLDIWFVVVLDMGVMGVALATVIARMLSSVLCFIKLMYMRGIFDIKLAYLKPEKKNTISFIRLGLPSALTQSIFYVAVVIVQPLINSFGSRVIMADSIIMRVEGYTIMLIVSIGTAMTAYAGQNVGAGRMDRVEQGVKQGMLMAVGISVAITSLILIFDRYLMAIYTTTAGRLMFIATAELVTLSSNMIKILAVGYIAIAVTQCLFGVMRGAGDTVTPMWISVFTTVIVRVPVAYGILYLTISPEYPNGRYEAIWISLLCSWVIGALVTIICYRKGKWKKRGINIGNN